MLLTVKEPSRNKPVLLAKIDESSAVITVPTAAEKFKQMWKLMRPSLLILCVASSIRNAGMNNEITVK